MKRLVTLGALVMIGGLTAAVSAWQQPQPAPSAAAIEVDKLRPNLFVLKGGGGNTAALITANGVVLVDTKLPGWGKQIIKKVKDITDKPVITIVNTHTHFDRVGGNVEFPATVDVVDAGEHGNADARDEPGVRIRPAHSRTFSRRTTARGLGETDIHGSNDVRQR